MKILSAIFFSLIIIFSNTNHLFAQQNDSTKITIEKNDLKSSMKRSPELQTILENAVKETLANLSDKTVKPEEIAASIIDLSDSNNYKTAEFNGEKKIYPASVVKMFYMVRLHQMLEEGKLKLLPELERGLKDMIEISSNDATQYILDALTDTSSGPELPEKEFAEWSYKRNSVNRYFASLGYENINVNQKTYCEDAYGREQQFRKFKGENRNMLTTNATARLLAEIALGKIVTVERSSQMLDLMKRDPFAATNDNEDQAHGFTGISLVELGMKDAKLFSKAGWTSTTRHDAAYIESPDGLKLIIVIFTQNHAGQRNIIPGIATKVIRNLRKN
jgi:beta-lactamase class A